MIKKNRKYISGTGARMRKVREKLELSQIEMAARMGMKTGGYYKNENSETFPGAKTLHLLQKDFDISMDWFIFNKGPMFFNEKQAEIKMETGEPRVKEISPELKGLIDQMEQDPRLHHEIFAFYYKYKENSTETTP